MKTSEKICDLNIKDALSTSKFIEEQATFFGAKLIELKKDEYLSN